MSALKDETRQLLFIGSSTTAGTGPSSPDKVYTALIDDALPIDEISVLAEGGTLVVDWIGQATATGSPLASNYLIASDADAADISIGDLVTLETSAGVLKESGKVFTVTSMPSSSGFTNITYTPNSAAIVTAGDVMRRVYSSTPKDIVVVQLGINDWYVPVSDSTFDTQIHTLFKQIRVTSPMAEIYWLRAWMPNSDDPARIAQWQSHGEITEAAVEVDYGGHFIDMTQPNRALYWIDDTGWHYNDAGHDLMAYELLRWFKGEMG